MPEKVEITRTQIIVVGEIKGLTAGQYPKWVWTDKEGKEYKVKAKNKDYFTDIIKPGEAVELGYSTFKGNEYVYNATPVADKLPVVKPTHLEPSGALSVKREMTKDDWAERDRITRESIQRQTALKAATDIACAVITQGKEMSPAKTIDTAKLFEAYLGRSV